LPLGWVATGHSPFVRRTRMLCRARIGPSGRPATKEEGGQRRCCGHPAACGTNRTIMRTDSKCLP
jgi:hypothetical protein